MTPAVAEVRDLLDAVTDPEIPVLTIADLGILRDVRIGPGDLVEVDITPTYSGCPAMDAIRADVAGVLEAHGIHGATVRTVLAPAWSTDWMSEAGRRKLADFGIAPPGGPVLVELGVRCPQCGSTDTRLRSRFSSTACKALYSCASCAEPFDHFKSL
ncbi:MAG TPA: 1,2-phenylacetyl-CoA epoxidase subunit PaaD [Mycobacteriales bacterium]|nr:1,2-phenylacetyl-CoA epoxidase subunit PaaD [Mycobacteriales bacterium]